MTSFIIVKSIVPVLRFQSLTALAVESLRRTVTVNQSRRFLATIAQVVDKDRDGNAISQIVENENYFIQNQFKAWPGYKSTVFGSSKWNSPDAWTSGRPVLQQLKEKAEQTRSNDVNTKFPLMDSSMDEIRQTILNEISSLSDNELFLVLHGLTSFRSERTSDPEYKKFWEAIDAECCKRMPIWDTETLFVVDDLLYLLTFGRASTFHYHLTKKICRNFEKGKREHFVRSMFVLNITRKLPKFMSPFELEYVLKKLIDELTPKETAIVCIALFKTETRIQDVGLIRKVVDKVSQESKTLESILVGGVAKFLRFTGKVDVAEPISKFQETFLHQLHRLELPAALHLALAGTTSTAFKPEVIIAVKDLIEVQLDQTRLKEIERMLLALTMYNIDAESFYKKAAEEIQQEKRIDEIEAYGKCLPPILYYLSLRGIYIYSLIDKVLQPKFLRKYYGKNMQKYQRELVCLDFSVGLDCPDYKGARLSDKIRHIITKYNIFWANPLNVERITGHMGFLRQVVKSSAEILGGDQYIHWCNVLPHHYTAELVFCLDEKKNPVQIPQALRDIPDYEVKWIPTGNSNLSFHAIFVSNRGSSPYNQVGLFGQKIDQVKQLTKMGYQVHTIVALEWQACEDDPEKQKQLLLEKVFKHTRNPKLLESVVG